MKSCEEELFVCYSFMSITCLISMFICNTATCAMICPILKVKNLVNIMMVRFSMIIRNSNDNTEIIIYKLKTPPHWPGGARAGLLEGEVQGRRGGGRRQGTQSKTESWAIPAESGKGFWRFCIKHAMAKVSLKCEGDVLRGGCLCSQHWGHRNLDRIWAQCHFEGETMF